MFAQSCSAKGGGECGGHEFRAPRPLTFIAVGIFICIQEAILLAANTGDGGAVLAEDAVFALGKALEADWAFGDSGSSGSHL